VLQLFTIDCIKKGLEKAKKTRPEHFPTPESKGPCKVCLQKECLCFYRANDSEAKKFLGPFAQSGDPQHSDATITEAKKGAGLIEAMGEGASASKLPGRLKIGASVDVWLEQQKRWSTGTIESFHVEKSGETLVDILLLECEASEDRPIIQGLSSTRICILDPHIQAGEKVHVSFGIELPRDWKAAVVVSERDDGTFDVRLDVPDEHESRPVHRFEVATQLDIARRSQTGTHFFRRQGRGRTSSKAAEDIANLFATFDRPTDELPAGERRKMSQELVGDVLQSVMRRVSFLGDGRE